MQEVQGKEVLSPSEVQGTLTQPRHTGAEGGALFTHKCFREVGLQGAGEEKPQEEAEAGHSQQQEDATQDNKEDPGKACEEVTTG